MKILHLISQKPNSTGSGMYVQAMIREAEACGYDNFLVAGISTQYLDDINFIPQDKTMFVKFHNADVSFHIPGMSDVMPYDSVRFCDLSEEDINEYEQAFSNTLQRAVKEFKPDIIHSHHLWIVSSLVRQLFPNIPIVTSCHGTDLRQFQNCAHLRKRVLKGCEKIDRVLALSEDQQKKITRLYNIKSEKIHLVGVGFNNNLFYPEAKPEHELLQLVYAGKLSNSKGVPWLLRALKKINSLPWQLHLIGSGTGVEKENCLRNAKQMGNKIIIHGAIPQNKLAEIMRRSHIFILPSFYEGVALVVLEAIACGCRIVVTDLPGINEVIGDHKSDYISRVKLPRLYNIDKPYKEDEDEFEQDLQAAIQQQLDAALKYPEIDLSSIQNKIESFTWTCVFEKVNQVYLKCLE